jgi:hypothetical protein
MESLTEKMIKVRIVDYTQAPNAWPRSFISKFKIIFFQLLAYVLHVCLFRNLEPCIFAKNTRTMDIKPNLRAAHFA